MKYNLQLSKLRLKGFRGFEQAIELRFDPRLTVLIGDNASGKTTILDAIAIGLMYLRHQITGGKMYNFPAPLDPVKKKNYDVNNNSEELECALEIRINARRQTEYDSIEYEESEITEAGFVLRATGDKSTNVEKFYLPQNNTETIEPDNATKEEILPDFALHLYNKYLKGELKNLPVLVYYGCNSINTDTEKTTIDGMARITDLAITDTYKNALESREFRFEQVLLLLDRRQKSMFQDRRQNDRFIDALQTAIAIMLNDTETENKGATYGNLRIQYGSLFDEVLIDKITNGKTSILYLNQLSSGEKFLLGMVADLVRRLFLANTEGDLLQGKGIVLIDEVDLHLHPKWQQKVIDKLMEIFPEVQFVVTTHSAMVLSSEKTRPQFTYLLTENKAVSIEDLGVFINGVEPNRILQYVMSVPLRNIETQQAINTITQSLKNKTFDTEEITKLIVQLTQKLGKQDPFIMLLQYELLLLKRKKQAVIQ
ncbi:MAG TPA: AAA family ATPase [Chitinophagales bacterium]|nr:AAA family ATPase [Chitinophagales bacterium]